MIKKRTAAFLLAAVLGAAAFAGCGAKNEGEPDDRYDPEQRTSSNTTVLADYPEQAFTVEDGEDFSLSDAYTEWWQSYTPLLAASENAQEGMAEYYELIISEFMSRAGDENAVCSPLNIYIALAMLAEVTDGGSRDQILEVLHAADIEELRAKAKALWESNYVDTPNLTSLLANSLWLRNSDIYNEETLKTLAEQYYASSFAGEMGSEEFNRMLQEWTDENTGGLLSDYTKDLKMQAETVMALVSAIYYKAAWRESFNEDNTFPVTFHGKAGDVQADMMHMKQDMTYIEGTNFTAVQLYLSDSGWITFFLPDEGVEPSEVMAGEEMLKLAIDREAYSSRMARVNLSIPKFKAEQKTDLLGIMADLGITDVLDPGKSDFSPLVKPGTTEPLAVSSAEHAAMLEVDEDGVTGAAYTVIMIEETALAIEEPEEEYFTLDRPFGFAVTGMDGSILFAGVVNGL